MNKLSVAVAIAAMAIGIGGAAAQTYPSRPITMIAPFPAGGPSDALARILSEPIRAALASEASGQRGNSMVRAHSASQDARERAGDTRPEPGSSARAALGQPVIIENVAGAGGNIGVGRLAPARPPGYTVGIGQWS